MGLWSALAFEDLGLRLQVRVPVLVPWKPRHELNRTQHDKTFRKIICGFVAEGIGVVTLIFS